MAKCGQLTQEIKDKARELLGPEMDLTQAQLRLMPYVQYAMLNSQRIDPQKINQEERAILSDWRTRGWIEGGAGGMGIRKDFYDAINELLWLGYVNYDDE